MNTGENSFSDIEGGLKAFFRASAVIAPLVGGTGTPAPGDPYKGARVFLGMPEGGPSAWPVIIIHRIGGGPVDGDYPMDIARVQIDCWADKGEKIPCQQLSTAVASTLIDLPSGTLLSSAVRAFGFSGFMVLYLPDPQTGRARYSVNCVAQAQAV